MNSGVVGAMQNVKAYSCIGTAISNTGEMTITSGEYNGALAGGGLYSISGGLFTSRPTFDMWNPGCVSADYSDEVYKYTVKEDNAEYNKYPFVASVTNADGTETSYKSLTRAAFAAQNGGTVKLIQDVAGQQMVLRGSVTLDLNGFNIDAQNTSWSHTIVVYGEDVKITDSSLAGTGSIGNRADAYNGYTVVVGKNAKLTLIKGCINGQSKELSNKSTTASGVLVQYGTFVMEGGVVYAGNHAGVSIGYGGTFTMTGGSIIDDFGASYGAVCVDSDSGSSIFNMRGGTIEAVQYAIYLRDQITSDELICSLNISGGEIIINATSYSSYVIYGNQSAKVNAENFAINISGKNAANTVVIKNMGSAILTNVTINGVKYDTYPKA